MRLARWKPPHEYSLTNYWPRRGTGSKDRALKGTKVPPGAIGVGPLPPALRRIRIEGPPVAGFLFLRYIPNGRGDVAFRIRVVVEIVDGDDPAIGTLHGAGVAYVVVASVLTEEKLIPPGPPVVFG